VDRNGSAKEVQAIADALQRKRYGSPTECCYHSNATTVVAPPNHNTGVTQSRKWYNGSPSVMKTASPECNAIAGPVRAMRYEGASEQLGDSDAIERVLGRDDKSCPTHVM